MSLLPLLAPYLPPSLLTLLTSLAHLLTSLPSLDTLTTPTRLLPLLVSLLTLYAALMSLYHTTRFAMRLAWFVAKWATIVGVAWSAWSSYSGSGAQGGKGVRGREAVGMGRRGVDWWANNYLQEGKGAGRGSSRMGGKKRWSIADEDEEEEGGGDPTVELLKGWVTLVTGSQIEDDSAVGTGKRGIAKSGTKKKRAKEVKGGGGGNDLASLAMRFALGRARSAWEDVVGGVQAVEKAAVGTGKRSKKR